MENYKTQLEKNGAIAFVPGGNSMWPTLKNRGQSVVIVKKEQKLKPMDVAFYQRVDGAFVLHRVPPRYLGSLVRWFSSVQSLSRVRLFATL